MLINRFMTAAVVVVLLAVPQVDAQVNIVGNADDQLTTTSNHDLIRWFSDPARVNNVIRTSDETNFLRSASFRQFGQYQPQPQSQPQGNSPVPPQPADSVLTTPPVPTPTAPAAAPIQAAPSVAPPANQETLPVPPSASSTSSEPLTSPQLVVPAPAATATTPVPSGGAPATQNGLYYFDSNSLGYGYTPMGSGSDSGGCASGTCSPTSPFQVGSSGPACGPQLFGNQCGSSCGNQCGSSCGGCGTLCDRGCNNWTFQTGALFLFRTRPNSQQIVVDPLAPGQVLDANNFSFGLQTGIELSATRHRAIGDWDFETRYFGIEDWSALQSRLFTGNPIQLGTAVPTFVSGPRRVISRYSSDLHNFEWNLTKPLGKGNRFLVGARHLQLNERLMTRMTSTLDPPVSTEDLDVSTRNRLYGLQVGLARTFCGNGCYCFEAYGKSGIYANDASQRSSLVNFLDPVLEFPQSARETELSFVHELGLRYRYRLCKNANFYTGYRGIWVQNVALASDQVSSINFAGLGSTLDTQSDVFYHGGVFGVEILF